MGNGEWGEDIFSQLPTPRSRNFPRNYVIKSIHTTRVRQSFRRGGARAFYSGRRSAQFEKNERSAPLRRHVYERQERGHLCLSNESGRRRVETCRRSKGSRTRLFSPLILSGGFFT